MERVKFKVSFWVQIKHFTTYKITMKLSGFQKKGGGKKSNNVVLTSKNPVYALTGRWNLEALVMSRILLSMWKDDKEATK